MKANRKVTASTLQWWLEQKPEILKLMFENAEELKSVLANFSNWFVSNNLKYPWGNSASFDLGLLGNAYYQSGFKKPWKFFNERCYRTAFEISGLIREAKPTDAHNPLIDCDYQIKQLTRVFKILKW